ncbi:type I polyketide synthase [Micromonospora sp. SCSIO 07396]
MDDATDARRSPVAIVGIALRLPGAANHQQLWDLLSTGGDAVGPIPPERFDIEQWFDPRPGRPGRIATRIGGFLPGVDQFDAGFFGLSAYEATRLDPQHRLMLHTVWEAVEDAGLTLSGLAGSNTGVYTACIAADYWDTVREAGFFDMHAAVGTGSWGLPAGRISHLLDLRGPSMGLEATCSSALLAVHLACRDLWSGTTDTAIVSGANLLLAPDLYLGLSEAGILTPDGQLRFGDAGANGYTRSEGVVTVVLKRADTALADGDQVYATILGGAANNNGRSSGTLIAPGAEGQAEMLRAAYADAGVAPSQVDYVEAHGAGTPRGDQVELTALREVLGPGRPAERPCLVGSVKSNIGHIEVAAGLAGLVKAALAIRHRVIPATLGVRDPHPVVTSAGSPLALALTQQRWPVTGHPAVAGVSSFGLSATNVHLVLGEAPTDVAAPHEAVVDDAVVLPLSARAPHALRQLAVAVAARIENSPGELADLLYSAGVRRSHHARRLAVVGTGPDDLVAALRDAASEDRPGPSAPGLRRADVPPRVVFVFSGQGSQWAGMAVGLLRTDEVFHARMTECDEAIRRETGWSLIDRLNSGGPWETEDVIQPALWGMQVSLAARWRHWGLQPDLVIGHSMGEVAAACVSGALSLADGAAVICRRSALAARTAGTGAMVAVQLGEKEAWEAIGELAGRVSVGVVNSFRSTVLAGDTDAVARVVEPLRDRGVFTRPVQVRYASHCPQVDAVAGPLGEALAELRPRPPQVRMWSTVRDRLLDDDLLDASYWMANLREQVQFASAVTAALADPGPVVFIEVSPHPLLTGSIEDLVHDLDADAVAVGSLVRDESEDVTLRRALAAAYVHGCDPDWASVQPAGRFVRLPPYPWQNRRYWARPAAPDAPAALPARPAPAVTDPTVPEADVYTLDSTVPDGVVPDLGVSLSAALTALARLARDGSLTVLEDIVLTPLAGAGTYAVRTVVHPGNPEWRFSVRLCRDRSGGLATWAVTADGRARWSSRSRETGAALAMVRRWCTEPVPDRGGAGFAGMWRRDGEVAGVLEQVDRLTLPQLLHATTRAVQATIPDGSGLSTAAWTAVRELRVGGEPEAAVWVHACLRGLSESGNSAIADVLVLDRDGLAVVELRGVRLGREPGTFPPAEPVVRYPAAAPRSADRTEQVVEAVAGLLQTTPGELDRHTPLPLLGMDSLLAARLRAQLQRELGLELPVGRLLQPVSLTELVRELIG